MSEVVLLQVGQSRISLVYHGMRQVSHADAMHLERWFRQHVQNFKPYGGVIDNKISLMPCGDSWVFAYTSPNNGGCTVAAQTPEAPQVVLGEEDPWEITSIALELLLGEYYDCYGLRSDIQSPRRSTDTERRPTPTEEVSELISELRFGELP